MSHCSRHAPAAPQEALGLGSWELITNAEELAARSRFRTRGGGGRIALTVSAFTAGEIAPLADQIDRSDEFPRALWPKTGALGLHGITVEEDYGGSGLGYLEHCVAMEEVSRVLGLDRALLRGAFEPLRQPAPPLTVIGGA